MPDANRGVRDRALSRPGALEASIAGVSGVGPKRLEALRARGVEKFRDALLHLPYRYQDLRQRDRIAELSEGQVTTVEGELCELKTRPMRGMSWRRMTTATLKDQSGAIRVGWFNLRGDGRMPQGEPLVLHGRVTRGLGGALELLHPELYRLKTAAPPAIRPRYSLPPEISPRLFSMIVDEAIRRTGDAALSAIPSELQDATELPRIDAALCYLHRPPADADLEQLNDGATPAHQALALDEMFVFQLALAREKARSARRAGAALNAEPEWSRQPSESLPFTPTGAQLRAISEIDGDLASNSQMNRILIGDVGSGKTLVAFHAILRAVGSGWQAAMMAPTELLAEQHHHNFSRMAGALGATSILLTGRVPAGERARLLRAIERGDIPVVFGTHALLQEKVRLKRLGLAVIDEQHRFGVFDRARLVAQGSEANVLLMTATPIPRSLAMTLLRNLDVSVLDEMPSGRTPVSTHTFPEDELERVDERVRSELDRGNRAYYVLPLIESEEDDEAKTVAAAAKRLSTRFHQFGIGTLHGRMSGIEKDRVMREFRDGQIKLLVATTIVEVGVDVPEATVIVIMAAERYGLAQLHQLRGRVGRGAQPSYCYLVISSGAREAARERVEALRSATNGNEVAELDLRTRGPGDLFGVRQNGALPLRFSSLIRDIALIERAGDLAMEWLRRDPDLRLPASGPAMGAIWRLMTFGVSLADIG